MHTQFGCTGDCIRGRRALPELSRPQILAESASRTWLCKCTRARLHHRPHATRMAWWPRLCVARGVASRSACVVLSAVAGRPEREDCCASADYRMDQPARSSVEQPRTHSHALWDLWAGMLAITLRTILLTTLCSCLLGMYRARPVCRHGRGNEGLCTVLSIRHEANTVGTLLLTALCSRLF